MYRAERRKKKIQQQPRKKKNCLKGKRKRNHGDMYREGNKKGRLMDNLRLPFVCCSVGAADEAPGLRRLFGESSFMTA